MNSTGCRPLTPNEWQQVLNGLTGRHSIRDTALIVLGTKSGFRIAELLSLRVRDVVMDGEIRKSVTVHAAQMKGHAEARTVPMNPTAAEALWQWLVFSGMLDPQHMDSALFPRQGHTASMTTRRAYGIIISAVSAVGLSTDRVGTQSLRKTFATSCWQHPAVNGDTVKMAKLLGHKNFSNTLKYIEFLDGSLEKTIQEI